MSKSYGLASVTLWAKNNIEAVANGTIACQAFPPPWLFFVCKRSSAARLAFWFDIPVSYILHFQGKRRRREQGFWIPLVVDHASPEIIRTECGDCHFVFRAPTGGPYCRAKSAISACYSVRKFIYLSPARPYSLQRCARQSSYIVMTSYDGDNDARSIVAYSRPFAFVTLDLHRTTSKKRPILLVSGLIA